LLPSGQVLAIDGTWQTAQIGGRSAELYAPTLGFADSWRPALSRATSPLALGASLSATGNQFRGYQGTEAASGATNHSATNYPLVQLHRLDNDQIKWLDASGFSNTSFTSTPVQDFPVGPALVTVFVNGIPSQSQVIQIRSTTQVSIHKAYLPLALNCYALAPDLVVSAVTVADNNIQVTIRNTGPAPVVDDFWVDLYVNPNPAPTHVNQLWQQIAPYGAVWGVTSATSLLGPGDTITLTLGDGYYWDTLSHLPPLLFAGTWVYVQADSDNPLTTYGAVAEGDELGCGAYNNVLGAQLTATVTLPGIAAGPRRPVQSLAAPIADGPVPDLRSGRPAGSETPRRTEQAGSSLGKESPMNTRRDLWFTLCFIGVTVALVGGAALVYPAAQPRPALAQGPADSGSAATQLAQITAASTVVQVGQWVTVTLTHGQPGQQGFFDAETPLRYQRTDGQPCAPGFACVTIDAQGQAHVRVQAIAASDAVISFTDVTADRVIPAAVRVRFYEGTVAPPPPQQSRPHILKVVPQFSPLGGPYLKDVAVANRVDIQTDITDQGRIWFQINGTPFGLAPFCGIDPQGNYSCYFLLPSDIAGPLQSGENTLVIWVSDWQGNKSDPKYYIVTAIPSPAWLAELNPRDDIHLTTDGSQLAYEMTLEYPVGGANWIAPTFISASRGSALGLRTSGAGRLVPCHVILIHRTVAGSFATQLYGLALDGDVAASLDAELKFRDCKAWRPELAANLAANGTLQVAGESKVLLTDLLHDYFGSQCAPWILRQLKNVPMDSAIAAVAEMAPSVTGQLAIGLQAPHVRWNIDLTDKLTVNADGVVYWGRLNEATVTFGLGGQGQGAFQAGNVTSFQDLELDAGYGYHVVINGDVLGIPVNASTDGECHYPHQSGDSCSQSNSHCSGSQATASLREQAVRPTYAAFRATPGQPQAFSRVSGESLVASATMTSVLVSDVYTFTQVALAHAAHPADDQALVLWTHDVPTRPVGSSQEIAFSHWDGLAWRSPAAVTNDDVGDRAPQVAWTSAGQAVAVWQRLAHSLPPLATWDITTTNWLEVASAVYSATTHTWSAPIALTANSVADIAPQLARNPHGQLVAAWVQNDYGQFIGDDAHPSRLMVAFYDGTWNVPLAAGGPITGVTDLAVGYGDNHATIALSRWVTPTGSLTATNQLFASTWNGSAWSAPRQLTSDAFNHKTPNVLYNSSNEPLVVWQTGSLRLQNLQSGISATVRLPREVGYISQLHAALDPAGNIVAICTASGGRQDLYLAYYDQAHNLWGRPRRLTDDRHLEMFPSLALDATGRPLAAYACIVRDDVTRTMTLVSGQAVTFTVPVNRQTDLLTLSHPLILNVSLTASDIHVSDAHPAPGSPVIVYAQVCNTGDLPIEGLAVSFYDGDPSAGGVLIGTSALDAPLAGGFTATLAVTYTTLAEGPRALYAIADPADVMAESDEGDNQAILSVFGPDLHLADVQVSYPYGSAAQLRTVVRNLGTGTAPTTTLAYYQEAVTGTLLFTETVPALAHGQSLTMTSGWDMSIRPEGQYNLVAVADPNGLAGHGVGTKQRPLSLIVGPDVMVSPYSLWTTPLTGTLVGITATVFNVGPVAATNVAVSFYGQARLDGRVPLMTQTVAVVPPGQAVPVSVSVPGPLWCGVYVYLDSEDSAYENRRGDVAAVSGPWAACHTTYLPIALRQ